MNYDYISICFTLRNRAWYLDKKLQQILLQNYDPKKIEICITDGYSDDNIMEIINKWYGYFYQIKYAISDRKTLPFKIVSNNPACDRNAQVCNQPTFEKCILTDAEVMWTTPDELKWISNKLNDKDVAIWYPNFYMVEDNNLDIDFSKLLVKETYERFEHLSWSGYNGLCIAVNKSAYIENGGFDERYALGFCNEDDYFLWWYGKNKKAVSGENEVVHLYHPSQYTDKNAKLRKEYTEPLWLEMKRINSFPNEGNKDWKRKEMIRCEKIFKNNNWGYKSIPKIANFYWGNEILPYIRYLCLYSFRKFNPDWKINLYVPKILSKGNSDWKTKEMNMGVKGKNYFNDLKKIGVNVIEFDFSDIGVSNDISEVHKSDLLRWYLLSTIGGIWSDMDILYFRGMNEIKLKNPNADTVICHDTETRESTKHNCGFLLSSQNNIFFKNVLELARSNYDSKVFQSCCNDVLQKHFLTVDIIRSKFPELKVENLYLDSVYKLSWYDLFAVPNDFNRDDKSMELFVGGDAIGIHWFGGTPATFEMADEIEDFNYKKFENTVGKIINYIMEN